jgi:hypothetical protein
VTIEAQKAFEQIVRDTEHFPKLDTGSFTPFSTLAPGTLLGDLLIWGRKDASPVEVTQAVN